MIVDFKYKDHPVRMFLHGKSDKLSQRVRDKKMFWSLKELEQSTEYIDEDSVVVDCGANIGNHTVFWGLVCKKVIAFEPFGDNFDLLQKNIAVNHINAESHRMVVSNIVGRFSSSEITPNLGGIRFFKNSNGKYNAITLDNAIKEKVNLLKIDVEGDEVEVLKGSERILQEDHPIIFIEIHWIRKNIDGECLSVLQKHGYQENVDVFLKRLSLKKFRKFK